MLQHPTLPPTAVAAASECQGLNSAQVQVGQGEEVFQRNHLFSNSEDFRFLKILMNIESKKDQLGCR
jgi:hypothetical protein